MTHPAPAQFHPLLKWFHWLIAFAIVLQYVLAELAESAQADTGGSALQALALLAHHKSVGITILAAAIIRLLLRASLGAPASPPNSPQWQLLGARLSHAALYTLLFLLPLSGWLMSSAAAYSVSWFNLIALPDLIGPDDATKALLEEAHEWMANGLIALAALHVAAALKHLWIDKDQVFQQMMSATAIGVGLLGAGGFLAWQLSSANAPAPTTPQGTAETSEQTPLTLAQSALPTWQIDYANSSITFEAVQAGAAFTGSWQDWQADIQFDANDLANSQALVTINTSAVDSQDSERDNTLAGPEFFNVATFPTATFASGPITANEQGYVAAGQLSIKAVTLPLEFSFNVESTVDAVTLTGSATIDRLAFNIGTGDWQDTTWVGQDVKVNVKVVAALP